MNIELTAKEFRRLLDMVYIGNWILNSIRRDDRFEDYDLVESKLFGLCKNTPFDSLVQELNGISIPSQAFNDGGIHDAIVSYEDCVFYDILAEELSRRDMNYPEITSENYDELITRMEDYINEFEMNGVNNIILEDSDEQIEI